MILHGGQLDLFLMRVGLDILGNDLLEDDCMAEKCALLVKVLAAQ